MKSSRGPVRRSSSTSRISDADDQGSLCLPDGPRFNHFLALPTKIVQTPALMMVMAENLTYRQVFLDGRALHEVVTPSLIDDSVGHWHAVSVVLDAIGKQD